MPETVGYLLLFTGVGVAFVLVNLTVGWFLRPSRMDAEKATIYECGEPTIGSAWVQFDLRFYVVALLFVIFDVEMAFFFPWAVVFGQSNQLADTRLSIDQRAALAVNFYVPPLNDAGGGRANAQERFAEILTNRAGEADRNAEAAKGMAWLAFVDILVFFGVLLVGFAYLWKRGDLDWVRSLAGQKAEEAALVRDRQRELVILTKD